MSIATVSSKGQVTLPVKARRALGIRSHDRVVIQVEENMLTLRPTKTLLDYAGSVGKAASHEDEQKAAMNYVAKRHKVCS